MNTWLFAGVLACSSGTPIPSGPGAEATVQDLGWLAGTWITASEPVTEEHWIPPLAGTMLGANRTIAHGETVHREHLLLEERAGSVFYVATPLGQAETAFLLTELDAQRAVFENPEHDFPKRIVYTRTGDALTAEVSADDKGFSVAWHAVGADVSAAVLEAFDGYRQALVEGDLEAALLFYADHPTFAWWEDGRLRYGSRAEVGKALEGLKQVGTFEVDFTDTKVHTLAPDSAMLSTTHRTTVGGEGGFSFSGAMTLVLIRTQAGWQVLSGHTSTGSPRDSEH
jgi:ketosteroid isomerase-like protein